MRGWFLSPGNAIFSPISLWSSVYETAARCSEESASRAGLHPVFAPVTPVPTNRRLGSQCSRRSGTTMPMPFETKGKQTARFWLSVVGDEGKSLLREYLAASRLAKMLLLAPTLGLWRRRQTRGLALTAQLAMIMAVLLVWTPPLVARVLLITSQLGLAWRRPTRAASPTISAPRSSGRPTSSSPPSCRQPPTSRPLTCMPTTSVRRAWRSAL